MSEQSWHVTEELAGMRLDRALSALASGLSRSRARTAIESGLVSVDGQHQASVRYQVSLGEQITASDLPEEPSADISPEQISLDVLADHDGYLVINKPAGMVMYPCRGHSDGTLANALAN